MRKLKPYQWMMLQLCFCAWKHNTIGVAKVRIGWYLKTIKALDS
jgi:hypothetical protein